jgi:hypothetical protein
MHLGPDKAMIRHLALCLSSLGSLEEGYKAYVHEDSLELRISLVLCCSWELKAEENSV